MTTYPLPTLACTISPAGITAPPYSDILASLQASYRGIYGSDVYLEPDSQDGQLLAVFASGFNDANNAMIAVYNSFSPATAQGAGLSSVVKINGLKRLAPSNSTALVTISGTAGTIISNGIIADASDNNWSLPATVTIPGGGSITVTATAQALGNIAAAANTITKIITPTRGWQSVTNPAVATQGAPVETDAALRRRQSISTGNPALSVFDSILGGVANLEGVERSKGYENPTGSTDGNGIPAHSICIVVEGGDAVEIATEIALKKTPGTGTYGTTTEVITDPAGVDNTINFEPMTPAAVGIHLTIKALTNYVSTTGDAIIAALAAYVNGQGIHATEGKVYLNKLIAIADSQPPVETYNVTVMTTNKNGGSFTAADVSIAFNEGPTCDPADITLTVI